MKRSIRRHCRRLRLEQLEGRTVPTGLPQLVLDINPATAPSNPANFVAVGSTTFFNANDGIHGNELWKTDGTAAGTVMVKDIYPGSGGLFGGPSPANLINLNGTLLFTADNGSNGTELWKSDGTTAGTVIVKDINPGVQSSTPANLTISNGTLFFSANDGSGRKLWKTDGTPAGTTIVANINPSEGNEFFGPIQGWLTDVNGTLFFSGSDGTGGRDLWKSNGTAAGTVRVSSGNVAPRDLVNVNGTLYFTADNGTSGRELWKSNGTGAGTVMVKDIRPGVTGSIPLALTNVNGTLLFTADNGVNGRELWKSDGTAAGTTLVKDIWPGSSSNYPYSSNPIYLTNVNGTLYFSAFNKGWTGQQWSSRELWKSDGTAAGTVMVKDINPGDASGSAGGGPASLANVNGTLYFSATNGIHGRELWKSDGTQAGTVMVADIRPGRPDSNPTRIADINGTLFFSAANATSGTEIFKSDGTAAGTTLVKDINVTPISSSPQFFTNVNGTTFFSADDGSNGRELWKSDGTAAGTVMVKDIRPATSAGENPGSNPLLLTDVNGTLFFTADDGVHGEELWKSDGTVAGTTLVKDIFPGPGSSAYTYHYGQQIRIHSALINVNGTLFFTAYDGSHGWELWKSDGTTAGTVLVKDIWPGNSDPFVSTVGSLANVNGTLFFSANNGTNGYELWKSDGTTAGTVMVKDINPGAGGSGPSALRNVNGTLFFTASNGTNGYELWKSDGTAAGTVMVADIRPGSASSDPGSLTKVNGTLFFTANNGTHGVELWKSDGTAAGTVMVADIQPGSAGSDPSSLTDVSGVLFFTADDGTLGYELWKSDGSAAGTFMVKEIYPGYGNPFGGTAPSALTNVNGVLYFTADDAVNGRELWTSDGTAAGTIMVADIWPGSQGSLPGDLANVGGTLYFAADDGVHGAEPWVLAPSMAPTVTGVRVNDGSAQRSRVTSITVSFSTQVEFAGQVKDAFTLMRNGGKPVSFTAQSSIVNGVTVVTLSNFSGGSTQFGSLSDGRYTLTALASQISVGGVLLDGDGDGTPGGNFTFGDAQGLFRMFGDFNGDRQVDGADFGAFSFTYGSFANQSNYLWFLDVNGDGQIDGVEFSQFSGRLNTLLP